MVWALAIAAGLALLFVLALAVPVELAFRIRAPGAGSSARLEWLFGLVGKELRRKRPREPERPERRAKEARAERRRGKLAGLRRLHALMSTRGFVSGALRTLRRILARVELRELEGALRVGLDDPADTGMLYAACLPAILPADPAGSRLRLEPVFDGAAFQLRASGRVSVVPLRLIPPLVAFACSRTTLRALWAAKRA